MRHPVPADLYRGFDDLSRGFREGVDFAIEVVHRAEATFAIVAPHGGRIEGGTSECARLIAGADHALYLFEGRRTSGDNFDLLHLTSRYFDEPRCLELVARCNTVVAVHGYAAAGPDVLLGGRDDDLKEALRLAFVRAGISCLADGHGYPGLDPDNICNRGRNARGVQMELSARLRHTGNYRLLADTVRGVLGPGGR